MGLVAFVDPRLVRLRIHGRQQADGFSHNRAIPLAVVYCELTELYRYYTPLASANRLWCDMMGDVMEHIGILSSIPSIIIFHPTTACCT